MPPLATNTKIDIGEIMMKKTKLWDDNTARLKVKACGVTNEDEAIQLTAMGYDALGFHYFPNHTFEEGKYRFSKILEALSNKAISNNVSCVLLVFFKRIGKIIKMLQALHFDTLQLYTHLSIDEILEIKEAYRTTWNDNLKILKVISARQEENCLHLPEFLDKYSPVSDAFLLDSSIFGGSGKTHDWSFSRQVIVATEKPVILAGGLNSENVLEAANIVSPYGVDVESGISSGKENIDLGLATEFIRRIEKLNDKK